MKSLYNALTVTDSGLYHKKIWKGKIPAKIKIFLWLIWNGAILTKDNMVKRKWQGDPKCYFCQNNESVNHLLFQCSVAKSVWGVIAICVGANDVPCNLEQCWNWCDKWLSSGQKFHTLGIAAVCWAIWKTRNKVCFENKSLHDPISIVCYACALMSYWAGLYLEEDKKMLEDGVATMLRIAIKLMLKKPKTGGVDLVEDGSGSRQAE